MAKKRSHAPIRIASSASGNIKKDLASWNFIIFLTLAFILLVIIVTSMRGVALDIRSRAGLSCPDPLIAFGGKLPKPNECNGTWKLSNDARGCQVFLCQPNQ